MMTALFKNYPKILRFAVFFLSLHDLNTHLSYVQAHS